MRVGIAGWAGDWHQAKVLQTIGGGAARVTIARHELKHAELYYFFDEEPSPYDFAMLGGRMGRNCEAPGAQDFGVFSVFAAARRATTAVVAH